MFRSYRVVHFQQSANRTSGTDALLTNGERASDWTLHKWNILGLQHKAKAEFPPGSWVVRCHGGDYVATGKILHRPSKEALPAPEKDGQRVWVLEDHARQGDVIDLFPCVDPAIWVSKDGVWVNEETGQPSDCDAATWMRLSP